MKSLTCNINQQGKGMNPFALSNNSNAIVTS
jgi:hypothetical protein